MRLSSWIVSGATLVALAACDASQGNTSLTLRYVRSVPWEAQSSAVINPTEIVASHGGVFVLDDGVPAIRRLTLDGQLVTTFGRRGSGPGEFRAITGFAVAANGSVAVADGANLRVTVYSADASTFSEQPLAPGRLGAIAYDASGRLHVDRRGSTRMQRANGVPTVQVLDAAGNIVS